MFWFKEFIYRFTIIWSLFLYCFLAINLTLACVVSNGDSRLVILLSFTQYIEFKHFLIDSALQQFFESCGSFFQFTLSIPLPVQPSSLVLSLADNVIYIFTMYILVYTPLYICFSISLCKFLFSVYLFLHMYVSFIYMPSLCICPFHLYFFLYICSFISIFPFHKSLNVYDISVYFQNIYVPPCICLLFM